MVAGCTVFVVTLATVLILLVQSGTLARFMQEMQENPTKKSKFLDLNELDEEEKGRPELYDSFLKASQTLPLKIRPPVLTSENIYLKVLQMSDVEHITAACNGSPLFSGCAYKLNSLWKWLDLGQNPFNPYINNSSSNIQDDNNNTHEDNHSSDKDDNINDDDDSNSLKAGSGELFRSLLFAEGAPDATSTSLIIFDEEFKVPIGMVQLCDNQPKHLTIEIANVWITPSRQGEKLAHESILLLFAWLFGQGYRRITTQIDTRNIVGKKFIERCGFTMEAMLLKHRVVRNRNRDTYLYRILNSDFDSVAVRLARYVGVVPPLERFGSDMSLSNVVEGKVELINEDINDTGNDEAVIG